MPGHEEEQGGVFSDPGVGGERNVDHLRTAGARALADEGLGQGVCVETGREFCDPLVDLPEERLVTRFALDLRH